MKLADINPQRTAWVRGRGRKVGNWSFADETYSWVDEDGRTVVGAARWVYHYGTLMGIFMAQRASTPIFKFDPCSVGWGSVSDQQGMNRIVNGMGGWYFSRAGGAKWVQR